MNTKMELAIDYEQIYLKVQDIADLLGPVLMVKRVLIPICWKRIW